MSTINELVELEPRPIEQTEAYRMLVDRALGKIDPVPAGLLVRHVLERCAPDDWPVRTEALAAALRRVASARDEELRIAVRPGNGGVLGLFRTRKLGTRDPRPYRTLLESLDPLVVRCDCPDYLRSSLGICKHGWAILEWIHEKPGRVKRAYQDHETQRTRSGLFWEPYRPFLGPGDWMDGIRWRPFATDNGHAKWRAIADELRPYFRRREDDTRELRNTAPQRPERRRELVETLLKALKAEGDAADPSLEARLHQEHTELTRRLEATITRSDLRKALRQMSRPLYPYQVESVERLIRGTRLILADDMGLGKTAQAIASCDALYRLGRVTRGLILVPASLKPQWQREWHAFSDTPVEIVDGPPEERRATIRRCRDGFLIMNYEQLLRDYDEVHDWDPGIVVLDEAQRIKNWATKTAQQVKTLGPSYRLVLTGTPMENRLDELASIVEWVDPFALEPKWRLGAWHATYADASSGGAKPAREVVGARNLETIRTRLQNVMVRRIRRDVIAQLPPRTDIRVPVEMVEAQREEHDALALPIARLLAASAHRPLRREEFLRLMSLLTSQRIISNGLAQLDFLNVWPDLKKQTTVNDEFLKSLNSPKLLVFRDLIRQIVLDQGRKVVVFSQWRRMLRLACWALSDLLADHGLEAGFFTGAERRQRRDANLIAFHDQPDFRILFASDAGGVGLNLQRAANCVINLELPWNPAVLEQRIGRIYRIGQDQPIDVYNLITEEGIEARIAGLVASKQALFAGLFDGTADAISYESSSSFLSQVRLLINEEHQPAPDDEPEGDADIDVVDERIDAILQRTDVPDEAVDDQDDAPKTGSSEGIGADGGPGHSEDDGQGTSNETGGKPPEFDEPDPTQTRPRSRPVATNVLGQLQIKRRPDGGLTIDAPGESGAALADLLETFAQTLRHASDGSGDDEPS